MGIVTLIWVNKVSGTKSNLRKQAKQDQYSHSCKLYDLTNAILSHIGDSIHDIVVSGRARAYHGTTKVADKKKPRIKFEAFKSLLFYTFNVVAGTGIYFYLIALVYKKRHFYFYAIFCSSGF
jgi:hypothetical protein